MVAGPLPPTFQRPPRTRGHLLQGRYKILEVDGADPAYFQVLSTHIHLNPGRAKIIVLSWDELKAFHEIGAG